MKLSEKFGIIWNTPPCAIVIGLYLSMGSQFIKSNIDMISFLTIGWMILGIMFSVILVMGETYGSRTQ